MDSINATVDCYKSIKTTEYNSKIAIISYNYPLNVLGCKTYSIDRNNNISIITEDFYLVLRISILKSLLKKDKLEFIVRLTKCSSNPQNRLYVDLLNTVIDLKEEFAKGNIYGDTCEFYNTVEIAKIKNMKLITDEGDYLIRVLVRDATNPENKFSVQSITNFYINKNKEIFE